MKNFENFIFYNAKDHYVFWPTSEDFCPDFKTNYLVKNYENAMLKWAFEKFWFDRSENFYDIFR